MENEKRGAESRHTIRIILWPVQENGVAEVQTITSTDMETGKVPKEAFLSSVKEGDKALRKR